MQGLGGSEKVGAREKLGSPVGPVNGEVPREERLRAVHRHAQRAARELDRERTDSVLNLARALGAIDRDEVAAQFEARLGFLERQVERLVGRREQVDRAVVGELELMRNRVAEAIRTAEEAVEVDRQAREALETKVRIALQESEQRAAEAAHALKASLMESWEQTVEAERSERRRAQMEAFESELADRARAAHALIGEIRQSFESQMAATLRAAQALTEATFGDVASRLDAAEIPTAAGASAAPAQRLPMPSSPPAPAPVKPRADVPLVWDVEAD